jgi:hypothetical protein
LPQPADSASNYPVVDGGAKELNANALSEARIITKLRRVK